MKKQNEKLEVKSEVKEETQKAPVLTELEELRILHKEMKDRAFNSIGDIEVRMSQLLK